MTKLLEKAIARVQALPEELQDEYARMLLEYTDEEPVHRLTPEQEAELESVMREVRAGKIASKERMAAP
ncbi:MAG TPA: hypothetical protein VGG48_17745 [Rhizomicrobium sp.]|jgi:hypothetical protein